MERLLWMLLPGNQFKSHRLNQRSADSGISISRVSTDKQPWKGRICLLDISHLCSLQHTACIQTHFQPSPADSSPKSKQDSALKAKTYQVRGVWLCPPGTVPSQLFLQILKNQHSWNWCSSAQRKRKLASTYIIKGRTEAGIPERIPSKLGEGRPGQVIHSCGSKYDTYFVTY